MDYKRLLTDGRWQEKRLRVLERDNFQCIDTGDTDDLQVHHCWYAKGPPWETPSEYLVTVCGDAHKERQAIEAAIRRSLGRIFAACSVAELRTLKYQSDSLAKGMGSAIGIAAVPYLVEQSKAVGDYFESIGEDGK